MSRWDAPDGTWTRRHVRPEPRAFYGRHVLVLEPPDGDGDGRVCCTWCEVVSVTPDDLLGVRSRSTEASADDAIQYAEVDEVLLEEEVVGRAVWWKEGSGPWRSGVVRRVDVHGCEVSSPMMGSPTVGWGRVRAVEVGS